MKTLAIWALAGFAVVSCAKQLQEMGGEPVAFSSAWDKPATKTTSPLPNNTTFGVMAWYTGQDDWSTSAGPNFMFNEDVLFDGSTYTYAPIKYWPNNPGDKVTFWAYSPYTTTASFLKDHGEVTNYSNTSTGIPDINFTLTDGKTDLMVTHLDESAPYIVKDLSKQAVSETVDLLFHHILCRVNFIFRLSSDGFDVNLTQIRFDHVYGTGIYDSASGWRDKDGNISLTAFTGTLPLSTSDTSPESVMLLPQTLAAPEVNLHIEYTVDEVEYSGDIVLSTKHVSWDINTQYNYTVTITPGVPIMFLAEIKPWEEESGYYPLTL